jgi:periplasmic protein TonB
LTWLKKITPLQWALGISLAIHAALLTFKIVAPEEFNRVFKDSALDVVLVNTRANDDAPEKPRVIAQTQLAGGGEVEKGFSASPLPTAPSNSDGTSAENMQKQLNAMQQQQSALLAQVKQLISQLPPPQPKKKSETTDENEQKRRQLLKLLGAIEQRINQESARPRKHYVSPATKEAAYAMYYDALRKKVEKHGTLYFPQVGGRKLYGELIMVITVLNTGQVISTEIAQSSGQPELDRRAQAIVAAAGPFGNFSNDMRAQADQLVVVSRFVFGHDNELHTDAAAPQSP